MLVKKKSKIIPVEIRNTSRIVLILPLFGLSFQSFDLRCPQWFLKSNRGLSRVFEPLRSLLLQSSVFITIVAVLVGLHTLDISWLQFVPLCKSSKALHVETVVTQPPFCEHFCRRHYLCLVRGSVVWNFVLQLFNYPAFFSWCLKVCACKKKSKIIPVEIRNRQRLTKTSIPKS